MSHLIIGAGEVGTSLHKVLSSDYGTFLRDVEEIDLSNASIEVLHICFPYSSSFLVEVRHYIYRHNPKLIIIHSTVPIGTTRKLGTLAVHSPIEGLHPNLDKSMRTFRKHFGGELAYEAARIFQRLGIDTKNYAIPEITEAQKILSTSQYGVHILLAAELERLCRNKGIDYKAVVLDYTETYNEGYRTLGFDRFIRPGLFPPQGAIGGHCVVENAALVAEPQYSLLTMLANVNGERKINAETVNHHPGL